MSTSIEFMREHLAWVGANLPLDADTSEDPLYAALASVLRDAERFKALERAHEDPASDYCFCQLAIVDFLALNEPLAELADRLREGST